MVSSSSDGTLRLWDIREPSRSRTQESFSSRTDAIGVGKDTVVSASIGSEITFWDTATWRPIRRLDYRGPGDESVVCIPDRLLAVCSEPRRSIMGKSFPASLRVLDLQTGDTQARLWCDMGWIKALACAPGACRVVAVEGRRLEVWDLDKEQRIAELEWRDRSVTCVAVTDDGEVAVGGMEDGGLAFWNLELPSIVCERNAHGQSVSAVAISCLGDKAVSGSQDGSLLLKRLKSHDARVTALSISTDGGRAVSIAYDGEVCLWDLDHCECVAQFSFDTSISCCSLSPDAHTIGVGDAGGRVHFLQLETAGVPPVH